MNSSSMMARSAEFATDEGPDNYFDKSEECRLAAQESGNPDLRRFWLSLAAQWMELAGHAWRTRQAAPAHSTTASPAA